MAVVTSGLAAEFVGAYATGSGPGTNSPAVETWANLAANNDAALSNFLWTSSSGWVGAGTAGDPYRLRWNGATSESTAVLNTGLGLGGTKTFTYETWCYITGTRAAIYMNLITERPASGSGFSSMLVSTTDVYADWMDSSSGEIYPSLGYLPDTGLHHIVMCGTGTALRIYFDGVYDSQSTFPGGSLTTTTTRFGNSPSRTAGFLGDIATVRIYSTNIGDSGVSDNYNAGVLAYGGTLDAAASDRSFFIARGIGIG